MVAKCTGIIPIIPDLVSASGMKIGAVYKRVYGFTDLRGRPAGRGRARHGPPNQVTAGLLPESCMRSKLPSGSRLGRLQSQMRFFAIWSSAQWTSQQSFALKAGILQLPLELGHRHGG